MGILLLDTNVLIALGWPNHAHYAVAHRWIKSLTNDQWATCPMTECGFVRIGSNPRIIAEATTPGSAILLLKQVTSDARHVFWEDDATLCNFSLKQGVIRGHQQITDAYLLSLCLKRGGRLATFDQGILSLASTDHERATVVLLPSS